MMIPPSFADFGKCARDLFEKQFKFGFITVDHKSSTSKKFELHLNGETDTKAGKIGGYLETKHKLCDTHNVSINTKLETKNVLTTDLILDNTLLKGLKNTLSLSFMPQKEEMVLKEKNVYKRDYINTSFDLEFKPENCTFKPPTLTATAVVGGCPSEKYDGIYFGGEVQYDAQAKAVKKHQLRCGYQKGDLAVIGNILNNSEFQTLIYHKVRSDLEVAVDFTWNKENKQNTFGVASRYEFSPSNKSFVKTKVNNASLLGLTYGFKLNDEVKVHLTSQIDAKNLEGGNHQFGVGIDFEV